MGERGYYGIITLNALWRLSRERKRVLGNFLNCEHLCCGTGKFQLFCMYFYQMLNFICRSSRHVKSAAEACPTHFFYFHGTHSFSTSLKSIEKSSNQRLFTVTYLMNSCGFTSEKALSASKNVKFGTRDKPDSVLAFLKNHGFTQIQISSAILNHPPVILCDTQKTLLPKLEFLKSKGLANTDIAWMTSRSPFIMKRSLQNSIIPCFSLYENLLQSKDKTLVLFKKHGGILLLGHQSNVIRNLDILRKKGVPDAIIMLLLMKKPRAYVVSSFRFRQCVDEVEKMGFSPSTKNFILAINALRGMTKSTREKKIEVYKKWGCTEDEILVAFKKRPAFMTTSEDKINRVMDFCVNKMGWESSFVAIRPSIFSMSLEKRIVPRNAVYQVLLLKGLTTATAISLMTLLKISETQFLKKVLSYDEEEAPELLKLYKETLDLAK